MCRNEVPREMMKYNNLPPNTVVSMCTYVDFVGGDTLTKKTQFN